MYQITTTRRFEKAVLLCKKRGLDLKSLKEAISILAKDGKLPAKYKPHKLSGSYTGCWECHIKPDWLMVWEQNDTELVLLFLNTGTHSDIF